LMQSRWCRGGAQRGAAEMVQRCRCRCRGRGRRCRCRCRCSSASALIVHHRCTSAGMQRWCRGAEVQVRKCRHAEMVQRS
jgi:hypothetical protein